MLSLCTGMPIGIGGSGACLATSSSFLSLHAEESPFRRGFTHAQKLVDCRPDTRRKAATGGTSGEFVCYLRVPISPASSEKSFLSSANCFESGGDVNGSSERSGSLPLSRRGRSPVASKLSENTRGDHTLTLVQTRMDS